MCGPHSCSWPYRSASTSFLLFLPCVCLAMLPPGCLLVLHSLCHRCHRGARLLAPASPTIASHCVTISLPQLYLPTGPICSSRPSLTHTSPSSSGMSRVPEALRAPGWGGPHPRAVSSGVGRSTSCALEQRAVRLSRPCRAVRGLDLCCR